MTETHYRVESESPKGQQILDLFVEKRSKKQAEWLVSYIEKICDDSAENLGLTIIKIKVKS